MARGDALDEKLRAWGTAQAGRYVHHDKHDGPGSHPISRAREFAPMSRQKFMKKVLGRDGTSRRRLMADRYNDMTPADQVRGVRRLRLVPAHVVDPVPCKESRHMGSGQSAIDAGIPPDLRLVDRAAMELYRSNTLRGLCLRMEYCGQGPQAQKAEQVARALGQPVGLRTYRDELRLAREWLRGRIAA